MTESEFLRQSQAAVERMREMNARSQISDNSRHKMPPVPSFVKMNNQTTAPKIQNFSEPVSPPQKHSVNKQSEKSGALNIPFIDNLLKDGDSALILGLLLILMSENTDKMLLFALVYILL